MPDTPAVTPPAFARIVDEAPPKYTGRRRANNDGTPATPQPATVASRAHTPKHAAQES